MLTFDRNLEMHVSRVVEAFIGAGPIENSTLTLDGMGVNSALQYKVLRRIGYENLLKLKSINIVSGSTYAFICFMAHHTGNLIPSARELENWDTTHIRLSKIVPLWTGLKIGTNFITKTEKHSMPTENLSEVLKFLVTAEEYQAEFSRRYPNATLWFYDSVGKKIVNSKDDRLSTIKSFEAIQAATSVPGIFKKFHFNEMKLSDPVYSPQRSNLYRILKSVGTPHLISNPLRENQSNQTWYLRPHSHKNGKRLLTRDFIRYLMGFRNHEINAAIKYGLFRSNEVGGI